MCRFYLGIFKKFQLANRFILFSIKIQCIWRQLGSAILFIIPLTVLVTFPIFHIIDKVLSYGVYAFVIGICVLSVFGCVCEKWTLSPRSRCHGSFHFIYYLVAQIGINPHWSIISQFEIEPGFELVLFILFALSNFSIDSDR